MMAGLNSFMVNHSSKPHALLSHGARNAAQHPVPSTKAAGVSHTERVRVVQLISLESGTNRVRPINAHRLHTWQWGEFLKRRVLACDRKGVSREPVSLWIEDREESEKKRRTSEISTNQGECRREKKFFFLKKATA